MNVTELQNLLAWCESAAAGSEESAITQLADLLSTEPKGRQRIDDLLIFDAYMEAAVALLPAGAIWRRYTDDCMSVYGSSPYNASAQVRYDGFNIVPSLALCAAHIRMLLGPLLKAQAAEARKAAA